MSLCIVFSVVLFNHNVNVRLEQMKKNNRCKVTMTPKAYIRQFSRLLKNKSHFLRDLVVQKIIINFAIADRPTNYFNRA